MLRFLVVLCFASAASPTAADNSVCNAKTRFDRVEHVTNVRVNDHAFQSLGVGNANRGVLTSQMHVPDALNDKIELLAVHLIVGYPTYSEYKDGAFDMFKPSTLRGGYRYQRHYSLSNGVEYDSDHNIHYDTEKNVLSGNFTILNFPDNQLAGNWRVGNFIETFMPGGPGLIKSIMAVEWQDQASTKKLHALINSTYYLRHQMELPTLHWRHVQFNTEHDGNFYTQSEKLTVVNRFDHGTPTNLMTSCEKSGVGGTEI